MKKTKRKKSIFVKIAFVGVIAYVLYILVDQQNNINSLKKEQISYQAQIEDQESYKESLLRTKESVNSEEFIEEIAREKLDMYLPNERVFIDI